MSVGLFFGVKAATTDEDEARSTLIAMNTALASAGLSAYAEERSMAQARAQYERLHSLVTRCSLDHTGGGSLRALGEIAVECMGHGAGPLGDIATQGAIILGPGEHGRLAAPGLPGDALWSTGALLTALRLFAPTLGIPLVGGALPDPVAKSLDNFEDISPADPVSLPPGVDPRGWDIREHHRANWLLLFEFSRVAHAERIALVLA